MVDSYVSRRFPLFHLKIGRSLTQFTTWHTSPGQQQVGRLKDLLFPSSASRHLRVKNRQPHREINLLTQFDQHIDLNALRLRLMEFAADSP